MISEIIQKIQSIELDNEFVITKGMSKIDISKPVELAEILFRKSKTFIRYSPIGNVPFEINQTLNVFECYTYKKSLTLLGILFFELLFSDQPYIELKIQSDQSEFKQLFVYVDRDNDVVHRNFLGLESRETYKSYEYWPQKVYNFPFSKFPGDSREVYEKDLPTFFLGCSDPQYTYSNEFVEKADQLIISVTLTGLIQLGQLLLDMGMLKMPLNEIRLENPVHGFGGVSKKSIEGRFYLPNSINFYTEKIEDLKFFTSKK